MQLSDKSTFSLLRTNPKISGNVKITIDSSGNVCLNSIDSTKELSSTEFKKFRVGATNSFEADLKRFMGKIPPELMFALRESNPDPVNTSTSFKDQLDLFYSMGAQYMVSNQYDEQYAYSAPIWLRDELPEHFVILRVDEPLDFPYNEHIQSGEIEGGKTYVVKGDVNFFVRYNGVDVPNNGTFEGDANVSTFTTSVVGTGHVILLDENKDADIDRVEHFNNILKKAHVVKTFDLTENSVIGKYIRNIRNNTFFPAAPVTVRFEDGLLTTWNGISYRDGIMTSKGEFLETFWKDGQLQIDFEEYITKGFERHGIICPMMLNLEFLFDDDSADNYMIPRYFGFYVNKIETGTIQLDGQTAYDNRVTSGNTPALKRPNKGFNYQSDDFFQANEDGVRIYYTDRDGFVPSSADFTEDTFKPRMYWLQDREGNFYSIDQRGEAEFNIDANDVVVRNTEVNLGKLAGPHAKRVQALGEVLETKGKSYCVITVNGEMYPNDQIKMYWNLGTSIDADGSYTKITANDLSQRPFTVTAGGTTLTFASMDLTAQFEIGDEIEIKYGAGRSVMKTVMTAPVYALGNTTITINSAIDLTTTSGSTPIVALWGPGSAMSASDFSTIYFHPYGTNAQIAASIAKAFNLIQTRTFDAIVVDDEVVIRQKSGQAGTNSFFMMSALTDYTKLTIQEETPTITAKHYFAGGTDYANVRLRYPLEALDLLNNAPDVYIPSQNGLAKISFVGRYVDNDDLSGFNTYGVLTIEDTRDTPIVGNSGYFIAHELFRIPVGLFSFFNVKDLDGDFFSSTHSRSPDLEYHRYFDIPAETPYTFVPGRKYLVKADSPCEISYLGTPMSTNGPTVIEFTAGPVSETFGSGNGAVTNFTFTTDYPPVMPGTVSLTDSIEIFTDPAEDGVLTGNAGGTGTIDYETGVINVTFATAPTNGQNITGTYTSFAGFEIVSGTPFVYPAIFHQRHIKPGEILAEGHQFRVFGNPSNDSITYDGGTINGTPTGTLFNWSPTPTLGAAYLANMGSPFVIDVSVREMDEDLKKFPGFWKMKNFSTVKDEAASDRARMQFLNRDKFFYLDLDSEYDYLKENYAVNNVVKSRLVPYITKWVYKLGKDVRDNDYRLNANPVFGTFNFSPSFAIKEQNPEAFSHEWYYLEQGPQNYPRESLKDNYYFFYNKIDMNELVKTDPVTSTDYFKQYFTFVAADDVKDQERYSVFDYNAEIGVSETFFRGAKIRVKEVIRDTSNTALRGIKPPFKYGSTRFDGYNFSAILRTHKQDDSIVESPVKIQFIENTTHKSITMIIDVIVEDYRTLTMIDPNVLAEPGEVYPYSLDTAIDYLLLYSMKSKRTEGTYKDDDDNTIGTDIFRTGDIKLSVTLNPATPSEEITFTNTQTGDVYMNTTIFAFDNPEYDWDLRDEVQNFGKDNSFTAQYLLGDVTFSYPIGSSQLSVQFGVPGETYAQEPSVPYEDFLAPGATVISIPNGAQFYWRDFPWFQIEGGTLYLEPIMQRISFGTMAEKVNDYSPYITYKTYRWNGTANIETSDEFYLEFVEPSQVFKHKAILPKLDEDKPEEFKNEQAIGVAYDTVNYGHLMFRHGGPFEPKFRDVLYFEPQTTDTVGTSPDIDLSFKQATFNPRVEGFGFVKNQCYLKVSNQDVLKLSRNPKYSPRYPLLDETPIAAQNVFAFQSSWDPGFWRKHLTKNTYILQAGTREMTEVKNFMGTKIMKTPESVRIQTFEVEPQLASLELVNLDSFDGEIVYSNTGTRIQGLINLKKRLLRFLVEDGASTEFEKYLIPEFGTGDPDELEDDVLDYLTINVLPTYEVKLIDFYVKRYKDNTVIDTVVGNLTDVQKLAAGYVIDRNFSVQKRSDFVYFFDMAVDPNNKVSLSPSFTVGKI